MMANLYTKTSFKKEALNRLRYNVVSYTYVYMFQPGHIDKS